MFGDINVKNDQILFKAREDARVGKRKVVWDGNGWGLQGANICIKKYLKFENAIIKLRI